MTCHKGGSKPPHILNISIRWGEWSPQRGNCFACRETAHRQLAWWANGQSGHDSGIETHSCSAMNLNLVVQPIVRPYTDSENAACKSKESKTILHTCRFVNVFTSHLQNCWLQATSRHAVTLNYYCSTTCSFPSSYSHTTCWRIWFVQNS